jgi:cytochrome b subunit of formate dehydrogenase
VTLSVVLLVGGIVLAQMTRSTAPGRQYYGSVEAVFVLATVLTFSVVGAIIASRQPRNAIGWIFCGIGLVVSLNSLTGSYAEYRLAGGSAPGSLAETAAWFSSWSWTLWLYVPTTFLLLLFPDGRLPSPRWRPVAWCAALGVIGFVAGSALKPGPLEDFPRITNPYGVDSPILDAVAIAGAILAGASMVASAVSLIVRMRRAGRVERQQIKWLAYGGAVVVGAVFVGGVIAVWIGEVGISLIIIGLLGVPIFTGVAILRYRLYGIDVLINRALVYAPLTAMLALVYAGGVVGLQSAFRAISGQESTLAVVASTLAIAALFNPLRRRVQAFVDRRFYRRKYDAAKTIAAFNSRLREETNLDALCGDLVGVAGATVQPEHVSLWLRSEKVPEDARTD